MYGIKVRDVTLFLGRLPGRRQECVYFMVGNTCYPVAYISEKNLPEARRLWEKFANDLLESTGFGVK